MKRLFPALFFLSLGGIASLAFAGPMPRLQVTVSDSAGKLVCRAQTNSAGTFSSPKVEPGNYVVQFNSKGSLKGRSFDLAVSAGKKNVIAKDVPGSKFSSGGVAMRVSVEKAAALTGQVNAPGAAAKVATANDPNVRIINGKRYVWVRGELGSNVAGRWVEEGSVGRSNVEALSRNQISNLQSRPGKATGGGNN